mmetsp:Transcript_50791/g.142161  ORF Transcript_50791/g.142161 Transcript_50791/m.142161 type:complete len:835 (-) Transcript_50791:153-2657(-)
MAAEGLSTAFALAPSQSLQPQSGRTAPHLQPVLRGVAGAPAPSDHRRLATVACVTVTAVSLAIRRKRMGAGDARRTRLGRHGAVVDTTRLVGIGAPPRGLGHRLSALRGLGSDWATLQPSDDVQADVEEMIRVKLPMKDAGGAVLTQFRCVFPKSLERYGEEHELKRGSTDNVYMLTPSNSPYVLVGLHEGIFAESFLEVLGQDDLSKLGKIIIQFFDGKQSRTLEAIVSARPAGLTKLEVHCSNPIRVALQNGMPSELLDKISLIAIKNKHRVVVEEGRELQFVLAPTPKLPEAAVAFDPLTGTLFSGKFFSGHSALDKRCAPFDKKGRQGWEQFAEDWFHLFDTYFFTATAQKAIRRIFMLAEALRGPDVQLLAPLHGPVVRDQCWKLMAKYEAWTEAKLRKEDRRDSEVLVMYASAYGNTKAMANAIEKGLRTSGVSVNSLNLEHCTMQELSSAFTSCNGFCVGSPTLGGEMPTQVKEALGFILSAGTYSSGTKKPCGVFGSYGWSGEAVDDINFKLKDSGFPLAFDPIRVKFKPTEGDIGCCEEAGVKMAQKLQKVLREMKRRRVRKIEQLSESGSGMAAFTKMRSSQCVLTLKRKNGSDVILPIAWVSQASFDPPAISISVNKKLLDRYVLEFNADESIRLLWDKYDADQSGALDTDELTELLKDMGLSMEMEQAMEIIDKDKSGDVTFDELAAVAVEGQLADSINAFQRMLSLQNAVSKKGESIDFTISVMPDGVTPEEMKQPEFHKKAKPANGRKVLAGAHAYMECDVTDALDAGDHMILLAGVKKGKVLNDKSLTSLTTAEAELARGQAVYGRDEEDVPAQEPIPA